MADIFISYASEDRGRIQPLAKALAETQSWSGEFSRLFAARSYKRRRRYMAIELLDSASEHHTFGTLGESADALYGLVERLYPIRRSNPGQVVRQPLRI